MGVYWLRAEESVAAVIARSESRGVYDWPSLSMQALKPGELAALWDIFVSATGDAGAATGDLLASDETQGTSVVRVGPEFVRRLAALTEHEIKRAAEIWANSGGIGSASPDAAVVVLCELASFAGSAWDDGGSVLQVADEL
jgi:hypothetical protein